MATDETSTPSKPSDYQPRDDFARSIEECYRVIRKRMANGGPPWVPKERAAEVAARQSQSDDVQAK